MASTGNQQDSLSPWWYGHWLTLFFTVTWLFSVTDSQFYLRGELGGNVTFRCSVNRAVDFLYLQKGNVFVNGYHASKNITEPTWENTKLDREGAAVYMSRLNISHSGEYTCHFCFSDNKDVSDKKIHLSVTARYSKPVVRTICNDDSQSCMVTCNSHGGYPQRKVKWQVTGSGNTSSQMWRVLNNSEVQCPVSMVYNSSSTVHINCSSGKLTFTCSVGDFKSEEFSVCTPRVPGDNNMIIVACAVLFIVVVTAVLCWICRKKGAPAQDNARTQDVSMDLSEIEKMNRES